MMIGGGMALAAPLIMATKEAAKLEASLKNVQNITRASNADMEKFGPLLTNISHKTAAFSKPMLADFASKMAQGGIKDTKGIQELMPLFADAADVLKFSKHMDPLHVAEALTSVAHQFGKYTPDAELKQIVSSFVTGMQIAPGTVNQFVRGGSFVNPIGSRIMGIDPTSLMALQITAAQTSGGGGGRGGMSPQNQMNVIKRSLPGILGSGLLDGKSPFALRMMGISDSKGISELNTNNKFDLVKLSDKLANFMDLGNTNAGRMEIARRLKENAPMMGKKAPEMSQYANNILAKGGNVLGAEVTMKALQYAYGSGSSFAAILGDKAFREQMNFVKNRMKNDPSLDKKQQEYSGTLEFSQIQASTDMKSLLADIGTRMLPTVTKVVKAVDTIIFKMDEFVLKHPKITTALAGLTAGLSGLLIAGGVGTMISAAATGLQFLGGALVAAATAYPMLTIGIIAGIAVFAVGAKQWQKMSAWVKAQIFNHADLIKMALAVTIVVADKAGKTLMELAKSIASFIGQVAGAIAGLIGSIGIKIPGLAEMAKNMDDFAKSKQGKEWTHGVLSKYAPDLEKGIDGFNAESAEQYRKKGAAPNLVGAAVVGAGPMKALNDAAKSYADERKKGPILGAMSKGSSTQVVNIQHGAIKVEGVSDPKVAADSVLRKLANTMRHAGSATTTAGGVPTSSHAYGAM